MGALQSIAQGILDDTQISLPLAVISKIPDLPYDITVVGEIENTLDITNRNPLGMEAHVKPSRATLWCPPLPDALGPELAGLSGEFAHFDMPGLDVGLGTSENKFKADFTVTNKTLLVGWTFQALLGGEAKLGVTGTPEVAVADVDPITYYLDLAKELSCTSVPSTINPIGVGVKDDPDYIAPVSITCKYARNIERNSVVNNCVGPSCLADLDFAFEKQSYPVTPSFSFAMVGSIPDYPHTVDGLSPTFTARGHGRGSGPACGQQHIDFGDGKVTVNFPKCPWNAKNHIRATVDGAGNHTAGQKFTANLQVIPPTAAAGAIRSRQSGKCLDLPGGDTTNGNVLWTWECDGTATTQAWDWHNSKIHYAADPSKCVDLPGNDRTNGNHLWIWDCNLMSAQQKWGYDDAAGTIWLATSEDASKCMDMRGDNSSSVVIWDCLDSVSQEWQLEDPTPLLDLAFELPFLGGAPQERAFVI